MDRNKVISGKWTTAIRTFPRSRSDAFFGTFFAENVTAAIDNRIFQPMSADRTTNH